jgi:predicted porin
MKKTFLVLTSIFSIVLYANSQNNLSFEKGNIIANIGIGFGNLYWGSGYKSGIPVNPSISAEYGITEQISVGGTAGFSVSKFSGPGYEYKYNGIFFGGRGSYHFLTSEKLDPYAGLSLGYVSVSVKDKSGTATVISPKGSSLGWGAHVGARYYFQPNIGVYAEAGASSFSILNIGATFKF